jgi:hypothetical protein
MRRLLRRWMLGLVAIGGCVTPSIPLPPPVVDQIEITSPAMGQIQLVGHCMPAIDQQAGSRFFAYNQARGVGAIALSDSNGCFMTEPFAGVAGEMLELWYEKSAKSSETRVCTIMVGKLSTTVCR